MGLLQKLIKTYDVMADKYAGVYIDGMREPLAPVSHALQNAQIEITIDSNGCFIDAAAVPKKENRTLIPVSLKSANRTSHLPAEKLLPGGHALNLFITISFF